MKYYVKKWNSNKTTQEPKIKFVNGRHAAGSANGTAEAVRARRRSGRTRRSSESSARPGRKEVKAIDAVLQGRGPRVSSPARRAARRLPIGQTDGNRRGYFFRTVPNDCGPGADGRPTTSTASSSRSGSTSSTTRRPTAGSRQLRPDEAEGQGRHRHAGLDQPERVGLLVQDREDSAQHADHLHPMAARPAGPGLRPAAEGRGQGQHQAVRLGWSLRSAWCLEDHGLVRLVLPDQPGGRGRQGVHQGPQGRR